jgi:transcriptional regulator, CopG family
MAASKIAITIDDDTLKQLDLFVKSKLFPNRSRAIQEAVTEKLMRFEKRSYSSKVDNVLKPQSSAKNLTCQLGTTNCWLPLGEHVYKNPFSS